MTSRRNRSAESIQPDDRPLQFMQFYHPEDCREQNQDQFGQPAAQGTLLQSTPPEPSLQADFLRLSQPEQPARSRE